MASLHLNLADGYRRLGALTGDQHEDVACRDLILTGQQRVAAAIEARDSRA